MKKRLLLSIVVLVGMTGCERAPQLHKFSGAAQGTTYSITYWSDTEIAQQPVELAISTELARLDKLMSNYRNDSIIEGFNRTTSTEPVAVGTEIVELVRIAKQINEASAGCYDLTISPLFAAWGFRDKALQIPSYETLAQLSPQLGLAKVQIVSPESLQKQHPQLSIDLSSIAQGYSVQRLTAIAEQFGIQHYLIEIGGELQTRGHKPDGSKWRVAIERPLPGAQQLQKIVQVTQTDPIAIMTSGTYRHYYDNAGTRYSHILDARSMAPVTHNTVSVTLLHDDLTEADAWSTALLCLGTAAGLEVANKHGLSVLFIDQVLAQSNEQVQLQGVQTPREQNNTTDAAVSIRFTETQSKALQHHKGVVLQAVN